RPGRRWPRPAAAGGRWRAGSPPDAPLHVRRGRLAAPRGVRPDAAARHQDRPTRLTRTPRHASVFGSASNRRPGGRRVLVEARAKVNLGLEVLGRRAGGDHALSSLLLALDLADP